MLSKLNKRKDGSQYDSKDYSGSMGSGKYEDGTEKHFEKIIQALRMVNEDEAKIESHRNGLTTIFTFRKFK